MMISPHTIPLGQFLMTGLAIIIVRSMVRSRQNMSGWRRDAFSGVIGVMVLVVPALWLLPASEWGVLVYALGFVLVAGLSIEVAERYSGEVAA